MSKIALKNAKIYVEKGVFAQALYAEDGIIRAVGTNEDILPLCGDAQVIDCGGKTVVPGFNDSHMHLLMVGIGMAQADITKATSADHLVEIGKAFLESHPQARKRGIQAVGWNQDLFVGDKRLPTRWDLDKISADIPIILERVCGHVVTVNSKVLELMGVTKDSPQFPGGTWEKDESGEPNGILTELTCYRGNAVFQPYSDEEYTQMFLMAAEHALSRGVTSVQSNDVGSAPMPLDTVFRVIRNIYASNRCPLRYRHQMTFPSPEAFIQWAESDKKQYLCENDRLTLGPLKLYKDGSLGARTATMRQEYRDDPGNFGVEALSEAEMTAFCGLADKYDMQVVTHAIGDKAISDTVGNYEAILRDGKNPLRHGLIHCQITDLPLLERIGRDDLQAMVQPVFLDYDMHAVLSRCGEALSSTSYAFASLKKLGAQLSFGTDSPVEDCDPFANLYTAVTRKDHTGAPEGGFFPQECVDIYDAVDAYTLGSAHAEFREQDKGRLKPGYLADFVVLDTDLFTCDPMDIRSANPVLTVVGGEVAWRKESL